MSQAGPLEPSGTPSVPTQFTTDSGIAVPAANNLNIVTPGGGTQGISTSGAGSTITITLTEPKVQGTATTVGAVTADVITIALGATPGVYTIDASIAGFTTAGGPLGAGYTIVGAIRTTGAAAVLITGQAVDAFEEGALSAGNAALVASGNNAILRVTGTVGTTIDWKAAAEYVFVS
jgi:hypothetical protein